VKNRFYSTVRRNIRLSKQALPEKFRVINDVKEALKSREYYFLVVRTHEELKIMIRNEIETRKVAVLNSLNAANEEEVEEENAFDMMIAES
jgi:hypothetical protein